MSAARVTFPFRGFRERPYSQSGLDITLWRQIPPTLVDYGDLWLTQTKLNVGWFFGERLSTPGHPVSVDEYPFVVVYGGELYLEDGHHRVVLDAYQGATKRLMREFVYGAFAGLIVTPDGVVSGQPDAMRAGRTTSPADRTAGSGAHVAVASGAAAGEVPTRGPAADCEDSPLPPGLQPDDRVWITAPSRHIEMHWLDRTTTPTGFEPPTKRARIGGEAQAYTRCSVTVLNGFSVEARVAVALYDAKPCPRCWPEVDHG